MRMISAVLLLQSITAFTPFLATTPTTNNPSTTTLFNINDLKLAFKLNPSRTFLLDVREPTEWAEAHLALASPSPLSKLTSGKWMDNKTGVFTPGTFPIDRATGVAIKLNTSIYVHCKMGGRAKEAVELLKKMGYSKAVALEETFDELAAICDVVAGEIQDLTD